MIEVKYVGRLGNNLFQYCLGRILAEKLGYCLKADPIPGFPNTAYPLNGNDYSSYDSEVLQGQQINLEQVVSTPRKRRIVLDGFFQRYEYYKPYREIIKDNWLRMAQEISDSSTIIGLKDMVIHVRLGDFFQHRAVLPFSWYKNLLENVPYDKLYLVTDEPDNPYLFRFKKYNPIVRSSTNNPIDDFGFITRFKKIVQSQSTFSWWASFLSNATEIYTPVPLEGYWSGIGYGSDIDLRVEESKYIYAPCFEVYKPSFRESFIDEARAFRRKAKRRLQELMGL